MNHSEHTADQLEKALFGETWYGPSWRELLEGVTPEAAHRRPIPEAHTIAEITLHAVTWHEAVRQRLLGEAPEVTDAQDWPEAEVREAGAWEETRNRVLESGRALCNAVREFPPERLHEARPGLDSTWYDLIVGEIQHVLYHAGQVGLLKKAVARSRG